MRVHHYGIDVTNLEEAMVFYQNLFDFELETRFTFMEEEIVFLTSEQFRLELIQTSEVEKTIHICFEVTDLQEVMNELDESNKREGPFQLQNGWKTVFYNGPNQEIIEFIQLESTV